MLSFLRSIACVFASLSLLATSSSAQVLDGYGLRFSIGNNAPGLELIDLTGNTLPIEVQGLQGPLQFNAGAIDPLNGKIWICESQIGGPTLSKLRRLKLSGTTAKEQEVIVNFGLGSVAQTIAFDRDSDVFVSGRSNSGVETVWRVNRVTGGFSVWDTLSSSGTPNAMTIDPVTNRMWVATFGTGSSWEIIEYDIDAGPGPGTVISSLPIAVIGGAFGLAYGGDESLFLALHSAPRVRRFDLATQTLTPVLGAPTHGINALALDPATGLLHSVGNNGDSSWDVIDLVAGTSTELDPGIDPQCGGLCPSAAWLAIPEVQNDPIFKFCSGDGVNVAACPCGNEGVFGAGCKNSSGIGAGLSTGGTGSASADNLEPRAQGLLPGKAALLFAGTSMVAGGFGNAFGDGLLCVGGSITRLDVRIPNSTGAASWGPGLVSSNGWTVGSTVLLQVWYRDSAAASCGSGFNFSNGLSVLIEP